MRRILGCLRALLAVPARPRAGSGCFGFVGWAMSALSGIAPWRRADGARRGWLTWLAVSTHGLFMRAVVLLLLLALAGYLLVRGSLPRLDGEVEVGGLGAPVRIE